jgi:hypothetical protein
MPAEQTLREEVARAIAKAMTGYPYKPKLIDYAAADAAIGIILERGAKLADDRARMREQLFNETGASINASKAVEAEEIAIALRALATDGRAA